MILPPATLQLEGGGRGDGRTAVARGRAGEITKADAHHRLAGFNA